MEPAAIAKRLGIAVRWHQAGRVHMGALARDTHRRRVLEYQAKADKRRPPMTLRSPLLYESQNDPLRDSSKVRHGDVVSSWAAA
jgi:hypothetical protein